MPSPLRHPLALESLGAARRVTIAASAAQALDRVNLGGAVLLSGHGVGDVAARAVAAAAAPTAARPVCMVVADVLPPWVGEDDLVVSFGPGPIAARARAVGAKVVQIGRPDTDPDVAIAEAGPDDRLDLPSLAAAGLVALESVGLVPDAMEQVTAAATQLQARAEELTPFPSAADRLARRIERRLPLVCGSGIAGFAARAWVSQFARTAKVTGLSQEFPGAAHDAVAGWGQHGDVTRQVFVAVLLRRPDEPYEVADQLDRYHELLEEVVAEVHTVQAAGEGPLATMLDLVVFGEQVALALALQEGLDPVPEPAVQEFRSLLRSR